MLSTSMKEHEVSCYEFDLQSLIENQVETREIQ